MSIVLMAKSSVRWALIIWMRGSEKCMGSLGGVTSSAIGPSHKPCKLETN